VPEQTKLPGAISDKDIDKTLSTMKTVTENVWLVNRKHTWIGKTSAVKADWYIDVHTTLALLRTPNLSPVTSQSRAAGKPSP